MARHTTRIGVVGGLVAAATIVTLSGLSEPAASAQAVVSVERSTIIDQAAAGAVPLTEAGPTTTSTTTAPPPPTTTTAPPPPTTAAPTPAPTTTAPAPAAAASVGTPGPQAAAAEPEPAPASEPEPAPEPEPEGRVDRVRRVFEAAVPAGWRGALTVRFEIIDGATSWAHGDGRIQVGRTHTDGSTDHLADVLAHEFGHLIAFEYGTRAYAGAAPEGWPEPETSPAEAWADCVQTTFTGRTNPSHGLAPCGGAQLQWATDWLAAGPPTSPDGSSA